MARRTRRFESLEERRLLAAVTNSSDGAALVGAVSPAASAASQPAPSASEAQGASPDSTPGDASAGEYAATPAGDAASTASASKGTYGSYSEYSSPAAADSYTDPGATQYYPTASSSATTPPAPASTAANQSALTALAEVSQPVQPIAPAADVQAAVISPGGPTAAPAAGAPGGPVRFDPHDLVARAEFDEPASDAAVPAEIVGDERQLVAPVAWATSGAHRTIDRPDADATEIAAPPVIEEQLLFNASPQIVGLIAGAVSGDWSKIERGVDELFERLERLGEELPSATTAWHVGECVALTAGAAAALEYVRAQFREGGTWQGFIDGEREPWEPRLRRRWFRRQVERITRR